MDQRQWQSAAYDPGEGAGQSSHILLLSIKPTGKVIGLRSNGGRPFVGIWTQSRYELRGSSDEMMAV